jgi:hypothetical protein
MFVRVLSVALLAGLAGTGAGDDKKPGKPKADPEGTPLELTITGKTTKYTLDTGTLTPAEFKKKVEAIGKDGDLGGPVPAAPKVDLTVEVKNTSDKPVKVWFKGDPVVLTLELKGKGAVNAAPSLAFTTQFISPEAIELAPGKAHAFPVKALTSGTRGGSLYSYWTEPGEYDLVATLKTGMTPAPKGAMDFDGFGVVTLTSAPLKLTVEAKK